MATSNKKVLPASGPAIGDLLCELDGRLRDVLRGQDAVAVDGLLSVSLPFQALAAFGLPSPYPGATCWANPVSDCYRIGVGRAWTLEASGRDRFRRLDSGFAALTERWVRLDPRECGAQPLAFLGLSFESEETGPGFSTASVQLPELLLERLGGEWCISFSGRLQSATDLDALRARWLECAAHVLSRMAEAEEVPFAPQPLDRIETMPTDAEWLARVERALGAIRGGRLQKVVLSRRIRIRGKRPLQARGLMDWLHSEYPGCVQYAYAGEDYTLVGASPERLVQLDGTKVTVDALASTTVRGSDGAADEYLAASLLASPKARREHQFVVDDIVAALKPACRAVEVPSRPRLMRLPTLQHLWSPIEAQVRPGVSVLQLVGRLHPTPAVGGVPRESALTWLAEAGESRGWYTGALGWLRPDGSGQVSVVLRCAVLRGRTAELYAGAGIVADSDPRMELAETELKFQTMLDALTRA